MIGNQKILKFLSGSVTDGKQAHAYLFTGPEHIGKTRAGLFLAQKFLQVSGGFGLSAREDDIIAKLSSHPDFLISFRERDEKTGKLKKNISVEQARELTSRLQMSSFLNSWKIAIVPEADSLSNEAANSLLKTLEEPKGKTIIILCAPSTESLLPTIVSRCQVINFLPVTKKEISDALISLGATNEESENFSNLSFGRPGIAVNFFCNKEKFEEYKEEFLRWRELASCGIAERLRKLEDWFFKKGDAGDKKEKIEFSLKIWNLLFRDVLYIVSGCEESIINVFAKEEIIELSKKFEKKGLADILNSIAMTRKYLGENVNPRLAIENLILKF